MQNVGAGPPAPDMMVCGHIVSSDTQFAYLGSVQCSPAGSRTEQCRHMEIAAGAMGSISRMWKQSCLSLPTHLRLYTSFVLSVFLHASELWTMTGADLKRLQAFHRRCQREIIGVRWYDKIRSVEITWIRTI